MRVIAASHSALLPLTSVVGEIDTTTRILLPWALVDRNAVWLYQQVYIGLSNRLLILFKRGSLHVDAAASRRRWAAARDPCVTRIGSFIRASRMEGVAQLVDGLRGEMGLVGLRRERPHLTAEPKATARHGERTRVLPGITNWARSRMRASSGTRTATSPVATSHAAGLSGLRQPVFMLFHIGAW